MLQGVCVCVSVCVCVCVCVFGVIICIILVFLSNLLLLGLLGELRDETWKKRVSITDVLVLD